MKKVLLVLFIIMLLTATSSADSLSTSKTIRLYLRVVAKSEMEYNGGTVDMVSFDEKNELETPSTPELTGEAPQNHKSSPFIEMGRSIRNLFLSLADTPDGMQRKY